MSWKKFVDSPYRAPPAQVNAFSSASAGVAVQQLIQCGADVQQALQKPGLSTTDFKWCEWALSASGGRVVVSTATVFLLLDRNDVEMSPF